MSSMTPLRTPRLTEAPSEARETNLICIQFGRPSSTRSLNAFFTAASTPSRIEKRVVKEFYVTLS